MDAILPKRGVYILAISGGVDSMVLLDLLIKKYSLNEKYKFIIAHIDHGMRADSLLDKQFVNDTARINNLVFVSKTLNLGKKASENTARIKRYQFLDEVRKKYKADAIVLAHHKDDLIETAIINLIRGTGRKGLSSLKSTNQKIRPLLLYSKKEIINYANKNQLKWHEDLTNQDTNYLRNYVRINIVPKITPKNKTQLSRILKDIARTNQEMDKILFKLLNEHSSNNNIDRQWFIDLPHNMAREILATWLRHNNIKKFNRQTLERAVIFAKVSGNSNQFPLLNGNNLIVYKDQLALGSHER